MLVESPTTVELLSDEEIEATTPPTLDDTELGSLHGLETVETQAANDIGVVSGVSSLGIIAQCLELPSGCTVTNLELGLFLRRVDVVRALRYGDFLRGLEELKTLPLKKRRRHLKNEVCRVSIVMTLSLVVCLSSEFVFHFRMTCSSLSC